MGRAAGNKNGCQVPFRKMGEGVSERDEVSHSDITEGIFHKVRSGELIMAFNLKTLKKTGSI